MNWRLGIFAAALATTLATATSDNRSALEVIHSRKSVRNYLDKPVSKADLETLLRAGMTAPSAAARRPWDFVVVTDKKALTALSEVMPYGKMLTKAGAAIVVCGRKDRFLKGEDAEMWVQDCSAATENILLAAESVGLGAVWLGAYPVKARMEGIAKVLSLPDLAVPLNVISIGWPTGVDKPKNFYDPARVHWEKW